MGYAQDERKMILNQIKNTFAEIQLKINKDPKTAFGVEEDKLISQICLEYGNSRRTAKEYISDLINANFIERNQYGLWPGRLIKEGYQKKLDAN